MAFGGDIKEITFNNAEVGSGIFKPKAGEGNTYDVGGLRTADDTKAITADGELIVTQNMQAGFLQVLIANDMNVRQDLEKAASLAASQSRTTWTFTCVNGITYRGVGVVAGDLSGDIDKATVPLKVVCPEWKQV
jgi:hypothetical protein